MTQNFPVAEGEHVTRVDCPYWIGPTKQCLVLGREKLETIGWKDR